MVVTSRNDLQCLQLLLDKGADVSHQDKVSSFHHEKMSLPHTYGCHFISRHTKQISCRKKKRRQIALWRDLPLALRHVGNYE